MMQGFHPASGGLLEMRVRRGHVLADAMTYLTTRSGDLKKPLRVTFVSGGVEEEGQDAGGITKEFFQLLVREMFNEVAQLS
jgi:hypothetical protein